MAGKLDQRAQDGDTVWQGRVRVSQADTGKVLYKLPGHNGSVNAVDLHPLEPIIGSASSDKKVFLGEIDPA
jgi:Prp8 binding protein